MKNARNEFNHGKGTQGHKIDTLLADKPRTLKELASSLKRCKLTEREQNIVIRRIKTHLNHLKNAHACIVTFDANNRVSVQRAASEVTE